jgi:uncharacterized protein (TIGR02300 family)
MAGFSAGFRDCHLISFSALTGLAQSGKRPGLRKTHTHAGSITLVKADLGIKRVCPSCGSRFYDLQKRPIECPKCAFAFEPESLYKQRRPRQPEPVQSEPVAERDEDEEEEAEETEEAATVGVVDAVEGEAALEIADDDDEEEAVEPEPEDAGMSVIDADAESEDIAAIEGEDVDNEDEEDSGLLEEVEDEESNVSGIIDPGIAKDER